MSQIEKVILLKSIKYGESDLILHALNNRGGKINFIAKSALKSRKRFGGGVLEPLNYIEVSYFSNKQQDKLHVLGEAKLIYDFPLLRKDYDRLELALYFLKVLEKISMNEDINSSDNFNLLGNALKMAETTRRLNLLRCLFEIKILQFQGVLEDTNRFKILLAHPVSNCDNINIDEENLLSIQKQAHQMLTEWLGSAGFTHS